MRNIILFLFALLCAPSAIADDGSRLWLRFDKAQRPAKVDVAYKSATMDIAAKEITDYWQGSPVALCTDKSLPADDGFRIDMSSGKVTITSATDLGVLYGVYELLRTKGCGVSGDYNAPAFKLRILNHWDNPDGSIERGYAGKSIFRWEEINEKKGTMSPWMRDRLTEYARANASVGINSAVLNNVNASPKMLTTAYISKVKLIADVLRPYGIKVFLSVNFGSPKALGDTKTADPLDKNVGKWWEKKVKMIYRAIPDFGGFLVKANSEGQPGPGDYNRTHAEGANMLATALKPYGGIVMWRSFVYGNHKGEDRVKQAVSEFKNLDGKFMDNVIVQCKNGPLDFQPREPYAPIFDQMKATPLMPELQITQEYLGQSRHLVYLAPMWKEFFGFIPKEQLRAMPAIAGVANIGDDINWCGHHFSQANWYAFGRLAWNPNLSSERIADEWLRLTFCDKKEFLLPMTEVMMSSREACVDYMMPVGLHHIFKADHHYGPEPDGNQPHFPIEWLPIYYHKADATGIGFNRSSTGTNATEQYREPYRSLYDNIETCPEEYLLWFHHVPWTYRLRNGRSIMHELIVHYDIGVSEVERYVAQWQNMRKYVDQQRFEEVSARLSHQLENAKEWRDVCTKYFQSIEQEALLKQTK